MASQSNYPYFLYDKLVNYAVKNGCDRDQVLYGSIPEATLKCLIPFLTGNGLQIGGFVGIAHCFIANALKGTGSISTIDPNISHRDIQFPLIVAQKMITDFKLSERSMLINGYAKEQMSILNNLGAKFDFIILDGDHDYLSILEELELANLLLKNNGLLILDDIDHWDGPKNIYDNFPMTNYEKIVLDSRLGLLQKSNVA